MKSVAFALIALAVPVATVAQSVKPPTGPPRVYTYAPGKFLNMSLRATLRPDSGPLIAGFVVDDTVIALIRVVGPSLSRFGIAAPLLEPAAQLYIGGQQFSPLQPWSEQGEVAKSVYRSVSSKIGAFPLHEGSKDLVMLLEAQKQSYTMSLSALRGSGEVLVEVYLVPAAVINDD